MPEALTAMPRVVFATPRKLPRASTLEGRVVVLDIAFAAGTSGANFEKTTLPFIKKLGVRLAMWVDHHEHAQHMLFENDERFVLSNKQTHPACPEMVTADLVEKAGHVDTICCHVDFDGICAAAKWIRSGQEPYAGADEDARAIDTRMGIPSPLAATLDRALRSKPRDEGLRARMLRYLASGCHDSTLFKTFEKEAENFERLENGSHRIAQRFELKGQLAYVEVGETERYDKTLLLLLGQERAPISVVVDGDTVTLAARFDSGIDLLAKLNIAGGMPTRVSVTRKELDRIHQLFV